MPQLLVRKVDEDLVIRLNWRAAGVGRSAEAEHRLILEEALRPGKPSLPSAPAATGKRCAAGCTATVPT